MNSIHIPIKPQNLPEKLIWHHIIYTYPMYLLGAQYICATLLATFLACYLFYKWWNQSEYTHEKEKIIISPSCWVWLVAVLVIELALIVGHINFNLEFSQILRASFTWYRNWGIIALFILIGHLNNIRSAIIYRAICIFCLQSLIVVLIAGITVILNLGNISYISPLKAFGGISESYRVIIFYMLDDGQPRLQLFAPWPPALGMVANIYFFLSMQEKNRKWRWIGMLGSTAMLVGSVSRSAILSLPLILLVIWFLKNLFRPWVHFILGLASIIVGLNAQDLRNFLENFREQFDKARSGSSRVRAVLERMAIEYWKNAPIWGHGRIETRGNPLTGFRPIGSHHTWFGILYTHGLVGFSALAIALLWSFVDLLLKAQIDEESYVGFSIISIIIFFTFADNIDSFAYIYWPGLIILGICFKQKRYCLRQFKTAN